MTTVFDNICTLPLPADLFAQALHPTLPILTVGLSSGHVQTYQLPPAGDEDRDDDSNSDSDSDDKTTASALHQPILNLPRRSSTASENGLGSIETIWSTRRHKGSCRAVAFSSDGSTCYSAGTDGLVKSFLTETGKVVSKIAIPQPSDYNEEEGPTVLHALSPQGLLLATDSGRLYYHDLRQGGGEIVAKAAQMWTPHAEEHVNALVPLPASDTSTSGFPKSWVSVGGTTLAVTDMRKGVLSTSEDQEVELTSLCFVGGLKKGGTNVGEKVCVGQGDGVISLWERGVWDDLDERVVVDRQEAGVERMVVVPSGYGRGKLKMNEKIVACGLEDGRVRFMRVGRNGILDEWDIKHDEIDGVVGLDFDVGGRMVSGGGQVVKVWTEAKGQPGGMRNGSSTKHQRNNSDDSDDGEDADSSDDEEQAPKGTRKKRKKNRGKDKSGGKALNFVL